jgi:hypothetical protein
MMMELDLNTVPIREDLEGIDENVEAEGEIVSI